MCMGGMERMCSSMKAEALAVGAVFGTRTSLDLAKIIRVDLGKHTLRVDQARWSTEEHERYSNVG